MIIATKILLLVISWLLAAMIGAWASPHNQEQKQQKNYAVVYGVLLIATGLLAVLL